MTHETLSRIASFCGTSGLVDSATTIVWHAGEPTVVPVEWYRRAHEIFLERTQAGSIRQAMQTNATLLNEEWCAFFQEYSVEVGVSLDGPAFLHDARRRTRGGGGTHHLVMRGIERLRSAGKDFHVLCVVGEQSVSHADELMDFFIEHRIDRLGFNVEEVEGANLSSTLQGRISKTQYAEFFDRILRRAESAPYPIAIREEERILAMVRGSSSDEIRGNSENILFKIVSFDVSGGISTFSPELLDQQVAWEGTQGFAIGNVYQDESVAELLKRDRLRRLKAEIARGVELCRSTCHYFPVCGGGAPSNKLAEHNSFASADTLFCELNTKAIADVVLCRLEEKLNIQPRR